MARSLDHLDQEAGLAGGGTDVNHTHPARALRAGALVLLWWQGSSQSVLILVSQRNGSKAIAPRDAAEKPETDLETACRVPSANCAQKFGRLRLEPKRGLSAELPGWPQYAEAVAGLRASRWG